MVENWKIKTILKKKYSNNHKTYDLLHEKIRNFCNYVLIIVNSNLLKAIPHTSSTGYQTELSSMTRLVSIFQLPSIPPPPLEEYFILTFNFSKPDQKRKNSLIFLPIHRSCPERARFRYSSISRGSWTCSPFQVAEQLTRNFFTRLLEHYSTSEAVCLASWSFAVAKLTSTFDMMGWHDWKRFTPQLLQ